MGGYSYDRDVYTSSSTANWGASTISSSKLGSTDLDPSLLPNGKILVSKTKSPIIIVLDVTGSNINFARIVYDKMPLLYGQIEQKGYLKDFDISFCAVGDAYCDDYPLQICDFAKGIELDSHLEKIVLESGGGGQMCESYELAAYYLYKNTQFEPGSEPIIFFIGDEMPYATVSPRQAHAFDIECEEEGGINAFALLRQKVNDNVFLLLNKYGDSFREQITQTWTKLLAPEHVIKISEEKAVVDLMLGIISMSSSARTLGEYRIDMLDRGQTQERIEGVTESLRTLSNSLVPVVKTDAILNIPSSKKSSQRGSRL